MVDGDAARAGMCVVYICVSVCMFMCVTVRDYMFTCMCMCVLVMVSGGSRNRTMGGVWWYRVKAVQLLMDG